MGGFKPGDEVVCIWHRRKQNESWGLYFRSLWLLRSRTLTVCATFMFPSGLGLSFAEIDNPTGDSLWRATWFRKVQRRDLTAWLATESTIEEPRRGPAKKPERV